MQLLSKLPLKDVNSNIANNLMSVFSLFSVSVHTVCTEVRVMYLYTVPMDGGAWWAAVHGVTKSWT